MKTNNLIWVRAVDSLICATHNWRGTKGKKLARSMIQSIVVLSLVLAPAFPQSSGDCKELNTASNISSAAELVQPPVADYGDAPDPPYPTYYDTNSTAFPDRRGPYHWDVRYEWIGTEPNSTTTVEPNALVPDLDFDDGLSIRVRRVVVDGLPTGMAYVTVPVTISAGADARVRYLNVAADLNTDGHWRAWSLGEKTRQREWLVENLAIYTEPGMSVNVSAPFAISDPNLVPPQVWVRATLTTEYIDPAIFGPDGWDGSGPSEGFLRGETEDTWVTMQDLPGWFPDGGVRIPTTIPIPTTPPTETPPETPPGTPPTQPPFQPPPYRGKEKSPVPDFPQDPNGCAPTATANSLYYLAQAHGFLGSLPVDPRELIRELKEMMAPEWNPGEVFRGVTPEGIYDGKQKFAQEEGLSITTDWMSADNGQIPTIDFIMRALEKCSDVEIAMMFFTEGGIIVGGHLVTVVGFAKYPDGSVVLTIHDPDDNLNGGVYYQVEYRGNYISLKGYPAYARLNGKRVRLDNAIPYAFAESYSKAVVADNFSEARDYLTGDFGACDGILDAEHIVALNASIRRPGALYLETVESSWNPGPGPLLYARVTGDFVATVKVVDFAGTLAAPVLHNDAGIMARDPASEGGTENWVSVNYFPTWTAFLARSTKDGERDEFGQTTGTWLGSDTFALAEQYPYLQLERWGSNFYPSISADGVEFIPLTDPAYQGLYNGTQQPLVVSRPDLPAALQVGLFNATYSDESGYAAFDDFEIRIRRPIEVENSSFEWPGTAKIKGWNGEGVAGTPPVDVPGWASAGVPTDSGVETGWGATEGAWTAFLKAQDPAVYQLTAYVIKPGEVFTLKVDAKNNGQATKLTMTLYYEKSGLAIPLATRDVTLTLAMVEYTLSASASDAPDSVGRQIGIQFANSSPAADSWVGLDNVRLSVTPAP